MVFRTLIPRLVALSSLLVGATASAGPLDAGLRVSLYGEFGFGGEYDYDKGGDSDAEASAGFGLYAEYPILQYFAVGFNAGVLWGQTEAAADADAKKDVAIDLSPTLIGRYVFAAGRAEFNVTVPLGLTITVPSSDHDDFYKTGFGFNTGLLFGIDYAVLERLVLGTKLGWQAHFASLGGKNGVEDADYSVHQFALWVGAGWKF